MPIKMRNDNVLIEYEQPPETTESQLLFIPDVKPKREVNLYPARVLAVGPGFPIERSLRPSRDELRGEQKAPKVVRGFHATELQVGDRVLVGGLAGDRVRGAQSVERRIIRETEVEAVVAEGVRVNG